MNLLLELFKVAYDINTIITDRVYLYIYINTLGLVLRKISKFPLVKVQDSARPQSTEAVRELSYV